MACAETASPLILPTHYPRAQTHTYTHTHTHIYIYIYIYTCVCVCVCVFVLCESAVKHILTVLYFAFVGRPIRQSESAESPRVRMNNVVLLHKHRGIFWSGDIVPFILNLGTRWRRVVTFYLRWNYPVPIHYEAIGFQRGSGRFREEWNFLPVPGFKRRAVRPVQQKLCRGKSKFEFCSELLVLSYCPNYK